MPGARPWGQPRTLIGSEMRSQSILFIRHGESEAHIGKAATHIEEVGLTPTGEKMAQEIANELPGQPDLIITSPYLCAWQTAHTTIQRFADVPYAIWQDVREFTYLGSLAGKYLTREERKEKVKKFWERSDPEHQDGNGESFLQLIGRTRRAWEELRQQEGFIVIFTHEQFIRGMQCLLLLRWWDDADIAQERMQYFRKVLWDEPLPYGYVWEGPSL